MLRELSKSIDRAWLVADVAICVTLFSAIAHDNPSGGEFQYSLFINSNGLGEHYGALTIAVMALVTGLGWQIILGRFGVYESHRRTTLRHFLTQLFLANAVGAAVLGAALFALSTDAPPLMPVVLAVGIFAVQVVTRLPAMLLARVARLQGKNFRSVVIVGSGPRAREATDTIERHPEWGLRVISYVDDDDPDFAPAVPVAKIHKMIELPSLLRNESVDEVLVACPRSMLVTLPPTVRECALVGVPVTVLTDLFADQLPAPKVGTFDSLNTLSFAPVHHNELELLLKRGIDIVGGTIGLLFSLPLIAIAGLLIRMDSSGPIFFRQVRSGLNGRRFEMIKLRTMDDGADSRKHELLHLNEMDGPVFKLAEDPRITPIGATLRRFSIDELPQFWNVVKGDMSLVGPRPPTPDEVIHYEGDTRRRLSMRPGLTCYWQVSGRNEVGFAEWIKLDLMYIDTWSLMNDLIIMLRTIPEVLRARGAR